MGSQLTVTKKQHTLFQRVLSRIWEKSPFYREFYGSHGIREKDLFELSITDLPLVSKQHLIDNFDRAVTDPRLNKRDLEEWFQHHRNPRERFYDDLVVVHSSGTSGNIGIFAHNMNEWRIADAAFATYFPPPANASSGKTRVAFYIADGGHFATVCMAHTMSAKEYDTLVVSVLDPMEDTVAKLNTFQPQRLTGYSSGIADLADLALAGRLNIHPEMIFAGGDKLMESMAKKINAAWQTSLYETYAASESKYIAVKKPGSEQMTIVEDLNIVEMLGDNDREVGCGEEGRVALTNLYNLTLPIVRYDIGDYVVKGTPSPDSATTIRDISGRMNDALPVALSPERNDAIHPVLLTTLFTPGIEKYQFISIRPDYFRIDYVSAIEIDSPFAHEVQRMLDNKGAVRTTFDIRRVDTIPNDPKTGKLRLVKFGDDPEGSLSPHNVSPKPSVSPPQPETDTFSGSDEAGPSVKDHASLPDKKSEPVGKDTVSGISDDTVRTLIERILSGLWREALGIDRVNSYENFFDYNGDSIAMGQIMARITEIFGITTSFQEFFDTPTVAGMTEIIMRDPENRFNGAGLDTFLDQLDSLSDDDVIQLLKKTGAQ